MMALPAPSPPSLQFPLGMDNLSPETQLPDGAARLLLNLDPYATGAVRSRPGLRLLASGAYRSLYRPAHGRFLLCWKDGALCRLEGVTATPLLTVTGRALAFSELNNETFWTDGSRVGRVKADGSSSFWGLPVPPSPLVTAVGSGGLAAGRYQVARTVVVEGIESGAAEPVSVDVDEGGGIAVDGMTGATSRLYVTPANGGSGELHWAADAASGTGIVIGAGVRGKRLDSLFVSKPIAGQALAAYCGRLWVASGSVLWFTDSKSPHWLRPEFGYFRFGSAISMLGVAEGGLFVGVSEGIRFLEGSDPPRMTVRFVDATPSASAAVQIETGAFSAQQPTPGRQCAWVDVDGYLCVGKPDGSIVRPHRPRYCMGKIATPVLAEIRRDGLRQVVIGAASREAGVMPVADAAILDVFTHGLVLGDVA